ncbi:DUF3108 domain-containing protein [Massilia sp. PAMC28688]|uniref:DUF3108 domain-containing protein n=1 Tax=Massilia sp. PAMC28688 TaxID=2861283 RepID=UPI001C634AE8|nr:DUF3108 domain-containing protein [Massilia sp. PAMC28688]QYF92873.1 DUF3108 domain-containing protein [Massilia sp. PAMC28688]
MTDKHPSAVRLATLLALSGCIHLLGAALLTPRYALDVPTGPHTRAVSVRLAPPPGPARNPTTASAGLDARPAMPTAVSPAAVPLPPAQPGATTVTPAPAPDNLARAAEDGVAFPNDLAAPPPHTMRWPAPNILSYETRSGGPGAQITGQSRLALSYDAESYSVVMDGIGQDGAQGASSQGTRTDDGFAPLRADSSWRGLGQGSVRLNRQYERETAADGGAGDMGTAIVYDRTAIILLLSGMGLHDSAQLQEPVKVAVGGPTGVEIVVFTLAGVEPVRVPLGTFEAWHLVQQSGGPAPLELWLAPELGWYPVQIITRAADGSMTVQRLTSAQTPLR